jgi:AraC-like DNA-binding protein
MIKRKQPGQWMDELEVFVLQHLTRANLTAGDMALAMNISERQLYRNLNAFVQMTPNQYLNQLRFRQAYQYIQNDTYKTIADTARAVGFRDASYFTRKFRERFGISPSEVE